MIRIILAICLSFAFTHIALAQCTEKAKEFIQKNRVDKAGAIDLVMQRKQKFLDTYPESERSKHQKYAEDFFGGFLKQIQACTDSDLASIAPNTKTSQSGSAASNCPAKIVVVDTGRDYYGMHDLNSYEIVSTNPISIRANSGTRFLNSLPGSPAGDQWGEGTLITDINSVLTQQREILDSDQRRISSCSQGCCDSAASLCSMKRDNQARMVEWLRCVAKASPISSSSAVAARTGTASTQSGPNVGNASEAVGQRQNRKNAFNPSSPQGASAQSQSAPTRDGECKNGDPSCAIGNCSRSGGKAITHRNNLGCGVVSCRFADTKYDWSSVYNNVPGSGCAGSTK